MVSDLIVGGDTVEGIYRRLAVSEADLAASHQVQTEAGGVHLSFQTYYGSGA